jgi:type I restriction enzyme S subunit
MASEWPVVRLGDVVDLVTGFPFESQQYTNDPTAPRLLRGDNVGQGVLRWDGAKRWSATGTGDLAGYWLHEGDVILAMDRPWIEAGLKYAAVRDSDLPALLVQRVARLRGTAQLHTGFLKYVIGGRAFTEYVTGVQTGTAVPHISGGQIRSYEFPLPSLPQQSAIAHILGTLDDKIELNRRTNETLEAIARALFKSWFVDFDPVRAKAEGRDPGPLPHLADLFPDSLDDSELGEIPKEWKVGSVDDEFDLTMGQSPPGDTYNLRGHGLPFYQGRADFGFRFPTRRVYCTAPTRFAKAGDTLVSVRAPVGDINMASVDCAIGRGVAAVRHITGSRSYSYRFMQSIEEVFGRFEAEGTVFGSIGKTDFHAIPCVMPPRALVLGYEMRVSPLDDRVEANEGENHTLAALRDTLLPKLMSGEVRADAARRTTVS